MHWLLASGLLACAALSAEMPVWVSAVFVLAVAWRYASDRFQVYRPGRLVRYALAALVLVATFRQFGTLLGRDPGLALLVTLLGLKLLELRNQRDVMFTLFLLYFVLMGSFLFGQTLLSTLWAVLTVGATFVAMIRLHQTMPVRAALRLTGELLLKAVPLLLLLYVFFPRISGTLWGLPTDAYNARTGMPDEIQPGTIRNLSESAEVAFRVDFSGARPPARELYWRSLVLWESDGRSWRRNAPAVASERIHPLGPPVEYRVTLEASDKPWLVALDVPIDTPQDARMLPGLTLVNTEPVHERKSYTLRSFARYTTGPMRANERAAALALPHASARVRAFAAQLQNQERDPVAISNAALSYFRHENFVYTLTPPLLGDDPVDEFLFRTRRGFCEHYASAYATLMRAAGIPARVVLGYQGGEVNPAGNYLIVRQSDAHAWNEIWLDGRGWVRVDPTAAVAPERVELGLDAIRRLEAQGLRPGTAGAELLARAMQLPWFEHTMHQVRLVWDYTNIAWYRWVVDYQKERQENFLHALGFDVIEWPRVLAILGGACVAILLAYVAWWRRVPAHDPVQRWYLRFCRKLARAGVARAPHEGPLDFAHRAAAALPHRATIIADITDRYLRLRYACDAVHPDALTQLKREVRDFSAQQKSA